MRKALLGNSFIALFKFPSNLTSVGQNIVIAFQLPVTNTSDMEDLSKVVMAGTPGERVEVRPCVILCPELPFSIF